MGTNKKKNKVMIYVRFAIIMVIAVLVGYAIGSYGMKSILAGKVLGITDKVALYKMMYLPVTIIFSVFTAGTVLVTNLLIIKTRKRIAALNGMDDDEYDDEIEKVQEMLNIPVLIVNVAEMIEFLLFTITAVCTETMVSNGLESRIYLLRTVLVLFVIGLINYMYVNNKCVRELQKLSPNIKGNVFDFHYQEDVIASLDEGQLLETALQSLNSTKITSRVTIIILIIAILGAIVFNTGVFAVVCLTIVLITSMISGNVKIKK